MVKVRIPQSLQAVLWSEKVNTLNLEKDKVYIVHQILSYGSLEDIKWLFKTYPKEEIKRVFVEEPLSVYTKPSYNFISNVLLEVGGGFNESRYIKSFR